MRDRGSDFELPKQYDRLLFDNAEHVSIASLPGMWERTVTIGSAGKTFSVTGWKARETNCCFFNSKKNKIKKKQNNNNNKCFKVGWIIGPPPLISGTVLAHQRIAFCVATPLQVLSDA